MIAFAQQQSPSQREPVNLMQLPAGRTCGDCFHFERHCSKHYQQPADSDSCEYLPSIFIPRLIGKAAD